MGGNGSCLGQGQESVVGQGGLAGDRTDDLSTAGCRGHGAELGGRGIPIQIALGLGSGQEGSVICILFIFFLN